MERWWQDLRYALRVLVKKPGFTAIAVISLALGIGANTAIFTVINAVFLHPLAIEDPSRVVEMFTRDSKTVQSGNFTLTPTSFQNFEDYRDQNSVFSGLTGYFGLGLQWTRNGDTQPLPAIMASANYFDVLGIKPFQGRLFRADEDRTMGGDTVAVISHSLWTREFGSDPNVIGQKLTFSGLPFTVIGVTPPGFKGTFSLAGPDRVWVPLSMREQLLTGQTRQLITNRRFRWINMAGRLKPGVSMRQADAAMKTIASTLAKEYPAANEGRTLDMALESDAALGINGRGQLVLAGGVMMGVVGLVLLIACANLANLLLAQSASREKEMSIRAAMGAGRGRIVRQLLTEALLLSILGGVAGMIVAYWGRTALWSYRPPFLGNASIDLSFEPRVLLFTASMTILTGLLFGLAPAMRASQINLNEMLKAGGRSGGASAVSSRLRSALVMSEIGLATVALIGAGLFVRSMQAVEQMDLGFDSAHIGLFFLNPGQQRYDQARGQQFYLDAMAKARAVPGVESATVASAVPLGGGILLTVFPEGEAQNPNYRGSLVTFNDIAPGYFETMRIPVKQGRDFTEFDGDQSKAVAVVNDALAKQLWPGQDALHKRFTVVQQNTLFEVVGVVATAVINSVGEDPTPMIYRPLRQEYAPGVALLIRTSGNPEPLVGAARDQVQTLDRAMPLRGVGTVQQNIEAGLWAPRMGAALLSIFGGLALVLAMIGVYGVMSYTVTQRTPELGVRMALGAQTGDVLMLVLKQGMVLAAGGALIGVALALSLARIVSTLLFGVNARDPLTLAIVTLALTLVALVACYIPARRAARVDPLVALRGD
ncbi:MAG TPA: ABC transporter permease [Vicinamibacterales bacterium]|jgi:predicted permease